MCICWYNNNNKQESKIFTKLDLRGPKKGYHFKHVYEAIKTWPLPEDKWPSWNLERINQVNNSKYAGGQKFQNKLYTDMQLDNFLRCPDLVMRSMSNMTDTYICWKFATQT